MKRKKERKKENINGEFLKKKTINNVFMNKHKKCIKIIIALRNWKTIFYATFDKIYEIISG